MKASFLGLTTALVLATSPVLAQSWETAMFEGGVSAWSLNEEFASFQLSCSDDQIPTVTIDLPLTDIPADIADRLVLLVDGEDLNVSWGFEVTPTETGVWLRGDANAQWKTVRAIAEKITQGDRLTVTIPSSDFDTSFDLAGARPALALVVGQCGLD